MCDRDRWIGAAIVPTKVANEYAIAELQERCDLQWLHRGRRQVGQRAGRPSPESTATALQLAGVTVKAEESASVRPAQQRVDRERCEGL